MKKFKYFKSVDFIRIIFFKFITNWYGLAVNLLKFNHNIWNMLLNDSKNERGKRKATLNRSFRSS